MRHHDTNSLIDDAGGVASRRRFLQGALRACAGVVLSTAFLTAPSDAASLFAVPSVKDQKKIGRQASRQILKRYKEIRDGRAAHFRQVGKRLVDVLSAADRKDWHFDFHVVDCADVDAYGLPGGPVFLFTGLYSLLTTDDELAALTGHLMAQIRLQQWAKAYAKQQEHELGISGLLTVLRPGGNVETLDGLAASAVDHKFTLVEEEQADDSGLVDIIAAGYNPHALIQLLQTLQSLAASPGSAAFLSAHPIAIHRTDHAAQAIASLAAHTQFPPQTPLDYAALKGAIP